MVYRTHFTNILWLLLGIWLTLFARVSSAQQNFDSFDDVLYANDSSTFICSFLGTSNIQLNSNIANPQAGDTLLPLGNIINRSAFGNDLANEEYLYLYGFSFSDFTSSDLKLLDSIESKVILGSYEAGKSVSNFQASQAEHLGKIELSWNALDGADAYLLFRSGQTENKPLAVLEGKFLNTYTDTDVKVDKEYTYYIYAYKMGLLDGFLTAVATTTGSTRPFFFEATSNNEAYVTFDWEFDNHLLLGLENKSAYVEITDDELDEIVYEDEIVLSDIGENDLLFENALKVTGDNSNGVYASTEISEMEEWTIELWVNKKSSLSTTKLFETGDLFATISPTGKLAVGNDLMNSVYSQDDILIDEEWTFLAFSYDGSTLSIFKNGQPVLSHHYVSTESSIRTKIDLEPISSELTFCRLGGYGTSFNGHLGMIRIWDVERNATQVSVDFEDLFDQPAKGLVSQWTFEEQSVFLGDHINGNVLEIESSNSTLFPVEWSTTIDFVNPTANFQYPIWLEEPQQSGNQKFYTISMYETKTSILISSTKDTVFFSHPGLSTLSLDTSNSDGEYATRVSIFPASKYADQYIIKRTEKETGETFRFENVKVDSFEAGANHVLSELILIDAFNFEKGESIVGGHEYLYEVTPYYSIIDFVDNSNAVTATAKTKSYRFSVSTDGDVIALSWNKQMLLTDGIDTAKILRNGEQIHAFNVQVVDSQFVDSLMLFGEKYRYDLVLIENGKEVYSQYDSVSLEANGLLEGRLVTEKESFVLPNTTFYLIEKQEYTVDTVGLYATDSIGNFMIEKINYGSASAYQLASTTDSYHIDLDFSLKWSAPKAIRKLAICDSVIDKAFDSQLIVSASFDPLVALENNNIVQINWELSTESDSLIRFSNIYRDDIFLDVVVNDTFYVDSTGSEGTHNYKITSYYYDSLGTVHFTSTGDLVTTFPSLRSANSFGVKGNDSLVVVGSWIYPPEASIQSFLVKRKHGDQTHIVAHLSQPGFDSTFTVGGDLLNRYSFIDSMGYPGHSYEYVLMGISHGGDTSQIHSTVTETYPVLLIEDFVTSLNSSASGVDHGVYLEVNSDSIYYTKANAGWDGLVLKNNFSGDLVPLEKSLSNGVFNRHLLYQPTILNERDSLYVGIYKHTDEGLYVSNFLSAPYDVSRRILSMTTPSQPTMSLSGDGMFTPILKATRDNRDKIFVEWEFPTYTEVSFELKRRKYGESTWEITFFENERRAFIDENIGTDTIEYTLRALREDGKSSDEVWTYGIGRKYGKVEGVVYDVNNSPMHGVVVSFADSYVLSDSTGYYAFKDLEIVDGDYELKYFVPGDINEVLAHTVTLTDRTQSVNKDIFVNSINDIIPEGKGYASIFSVQGTADSSNMVNTVRWIPSNDYYTGFHVYRGIAVLQDVLKGEPMLFVDSLSSLGNAGFTYSIVPYVKNAVGEVIENKPGTKHVTLDYPSLEEPNHLYSFEDEYTGIVELTWSHRRNNVDGFHIYRNDENIGSISATETFLYKDTTGIPNQSYRYNVFSYVDRNDRVTKSLRSAVTIADFPLTGSPQNVIATQVEKYHDSKPYKENYVGISWQYPSEKVVEGVALFRGYDSIGFVSYPDTLIYDSTGIPGTYTNYELLSYDKKEGLLYPSKPTHIGIAYPDILTPLDYSVSTYNFDSTLFEWSYLSSGVDAFELLIVKIYNNTLDTVVSEAIDFYEANYSYKFTEGASGVSYAYLVRAVTNRGDEVYYSKFVGDTVLHPEIPSPVIALNYTNGEQFADINWSITTERDVNYDLIIKEIGGSEGVSLMGLPSSQLSYTYVPSNNYADKSYEVYLKAYQNETGAVSKSDLDTLSINLSVATKYPRNLVSTMNDPVGVTLQWESALNVVNLTDYNIYRDGVKINAVAAGGVLSFEDKNGDPGIEYLYEVAAEYNNIEEYRAAVIGKRQGDGLVSAQIISTSGGGVAGDSLIIFGTIGSQIIIDTAFSNADGNVDFKGLPYNSEGVEYTIRVAGDESHYFVTRKNAILDATINRTNAGMFINTNSRTLRGKIVNENCDAGCAREGVNVTLSALEKFGMSYVSKGNTTTDADGEFSFTIPYDLSDYISYQIAVKNYSSDDLDRPIDSLFYIYNEGENMEWQVQDSLLLIDFNTSQLNKSRLTEFLIYDQISYPINVEIAGPGDCDVFSGYEFLVRLTDADGKIDELIWTTNQTIEEDLPPYRFLVQMIDVNKVDAFSQSVLDYFRTRSLTVDNIKYYKEYLDNDRSTLRDTTWYFRYNERASLDLTGISAIEYCDLYVLDADDVNDDVESEVSVTVTPYQLINGLSCLSTSGYIIPSFAGGEFDQDTLFYSHSDGNWPSIEVSATSANLATPYTQILEFYYYDDNGNFQGMTSEEILVLGKQPRPGNDVFVVPETNNNVLIPLYVLRDPPGDKSSAYIKEKSIFSFSMDSKHSHSGGSSVDTEHKLKALGGLINLTGGIDLGGGDKFKSSRGYEIEFKEELSTAKGAKISENLEGYLDGADADIVVGMSVIMSYGVVEQLKLDASCAVDKTMALTVDTDKIKSTWAYTRSQIKNTVRYYESLVNKNDNDEYEATDNVEFEVDSLSPREDIPGTIGYAKDMFQGLLDDMDSKFTPVCEMCEYASANAKYTYGDIDQSRVKDEVKELLDEVKDYCKDNIFKENTSNCKPMNTLIGKWNEGERESYRKNYRKYLTAKEIVRFYSKDVFSSALFDTNFEEVLLDRLKEVESFDPLENITFGAGSKVARAVESTSTWFKSKETDLYFSPHTTIKLGVETEDNVSQWAGVGGGVEVSGTLTQVESKAIAVVRGSYKFSAEESRGSFELSEFKTGFSLDDDDDGDHFSVDVYHSFTDGTTKTTPFFNLVGGRSSCPYEAGTITRDAPVVQLADEDGTLFPTKMYDLNPDARIDIPVAVSSGNIFGERREIQVTAPLGSNKYGLRMEMENVRVSNYRGNVVLDEGDDDPYYSVISFEKGESPLYDFTDIQILVKPNCNYRKGTYWEEPHIFDTLDLELHFRKPTSDISIDDNSGGLLITGDKDKSDHINEETVTIRVYDYDIEQNYHSLKEVYLEYKRENDEYWKRMIDATTGLQVLSVDTLYDYFKQKLNTYVKPEYPFVWDVSEMDGLVDGQYQIRAMAVHEKGYFKSSNTLEATIDRTRPELSKMTMPRDSVLSFGEEISATFTEEIDKEKFNKVGAVKVEIFDYHDTTVILKYHDEIDALSAYQYFWSGDNIAIVIADDTLKKYDGQKVKVTLSGIEDIYGNASDPHFVSWSFYVDYYNREPSNVSILSSSAYVINENNVANPFEVVITDYDVYTVEHGLDSIEVSYKHKTDNKWQVIDARTITELRDHYRLHQDNEESPLDTISFSFSGLQDGEYGIRATLYSGLNVNYSNEVKVYKDTLAPRLFSTPQPSDSVYSLGDDVSMNFTEDIDCSYKLDFFVTVTREGEIDTLEKVSANCYYSGVVLFSLDNEELRQHFGARATIHLSNIVDNYGNVTDGLTYSFVIDNTSAPTSSAKLLDPNGGWVINSQDTSVTLIIEDYDLFGINSALDSIVIQYRHLQDYAWTQYDVITFQQLQDAYDHTVNAYDPEYYFKFYLDSTVVKDGHYSVRAIVYGNGYANHTNYVIGIVDQTPLRFAQSLIEIDRHVNSDELFRLEFTEAVELTSVSGNTLAIAQLVGGSTSATRVLRDGDTVAIDEDYYVISTDGSELVIDFTDEFYEAFDNETIVIVIDGIEDVNGNPIEEPIYIEITVDNATTEEEKTQSASLDLNGANLRGVFHSNGMIELSWDPDTRYAQYEVERSLDGNRFTNLKMVNAASVDEYQYLDLIDFEDHVYYRLNQIDYDSNGLYTKVIVVHRGAVYTDFSSSIYPNPVYDRHVNTLIHTLDLTEPAEIEVYDLSGMKVYSKTLSPNDLGTPLHSIDLEQTIGTGVYSLKIRQGIQINYHRLVVAGR